MKPKKKIGLLTFFVIIAILISFGWPYIYTGYLFHIDQSYGKRMLQDEINHDALLIVCRQLISDKRTGTLKQYDFKVRLHIDPSDNKLPVEILVINPLYVWIDDKDVTIEMLGRYGVVAMAEDSVIELATGKKLIEGLIFFERSNRTAVLTELNEKLYKEN